MILWIVKFLCAVTLIQFVSGCSSRRTTDSLIQASGEQRYSPADTVRDYAPLQVEDLPSYHVDLPGFYVRRRSPDAVPYRVDSDACPDDDAGVFDHSPAGIVPGYRVQLFSGRDRAFAAQKEAELKVKYRQQVYLIYEAPLYKVRIGDFRTMDDANRFCKQINQDGYRDAWVVKSPVKVDDR